MMIPTTVCINSIAGSVQLFVFIGGLASVPRSLALSIHYEYIMYGINVFLKTVKLSAILAG